MAAFLTFLILAALIILYNLILIVPEREACVIERLGKYKAVHKAGVYLLTPFLDKVKYRREMREQCIDIPSQGCISRDNAQIEVDGLVYMKVTDAYKASYGIENYHRAAINLAQTTMRSEVGKLTFSELISERESLNETIVAEIDKASDPWGIKVLRYEVKNITPPYSQIQNLEKRMEAVRESRAEVIRAEAERSAKKILSEGGRQEAINISEGEKQRRINEAHGQASEISIQAEATAKGIEMVSQAVNLPGGKDAMKVRLLESFITRIGEVLKSAEVSVVPAEMAQLKGFFEGMDQVTQTIKGSQS
jgi:regulator of protease activity HflC (stomatin/prohibitin superfamily)